MTGGDGNGFCAQWCRAARLRLVEAPDGVCPRCIRIPPTQRSAGCQRQVIDAPPTTCRRFGDRGMRRMVFARVRSSAPAGWSAPSPRSVPRNLLSPMKTSGSRPPTIALKSVDRGSVLSQDRQDPARVSDSPSAVPGSSRRCRRSAAAATEGRRSGLGDRLQRDGIGLTQRCPDRPGAARILIRRDRLADGPQCGQRRRFQLAQAIETRDVGMPVDTDQLQAPGHWTFRRGATGSGRGRAGRSCHARTTARRGRQPPGFGQAAVFLPPGKTEWCETAPSPHADRALPGRFGRDNETRTAAMTGHVGNVPCTDGIRSIQEATHETGFRQCLPEIVILATDVHVWRFVVVLNGLISSSHCNCSILRG